MPGPAKQRRIALVSAAEAHARDEDEAPLTAALEALGLSVATPDWDDTTVDWSQFEIALIRATWDYTTRLVEFLAWARRTADQTRLLNPPDLVQWNTDKRYMADLEAADVPIIPSAFFPPGEAARFPASGEFVVKPSVGAGSRGARRFAATATETAQRHARSLQDGGFVVLVQPYLASVDSRGETALLYYDGVFSHAVRKGPLLQMESAEVPGLFAPEKISARPASVAELEIGAAVLAAIPGGVPLYARVDLIESASGTPQLLELELTEPSMFFDHAPGSAARFAAAITRRLGD